MLEIPAIPMMPKKMGGGENGSYTWYTVRPRTNEKKTDESPMLLEHKLIFK
jgi:hypothetical protein